MRTKVRSHIVDIRCASGVRHAHLDRATETRLQTFHLLTREVSSRTSRVSSMFARSRSNTIIVLKLAGILRFEGPARAVATQIDACNAAQQARSQAAIPCAACDGQSEASRCHHLVIEAAATAVYSVVEATKEQATSCSRSVDQQIRDN